MSNPFIRLNRRTCGWLAEKYPSFFGGEETRHNDTNERLDAILQPGLLILELGGADRPLLPLHDKYLLTGLDVDDYQGRAYDKYDMFIHQSVELAFPGRYDLIYSTTLIEHVENNTLAFTNIFNALLPGGITLHYFPCKNCCYAVILRLIGHKWQNKLARVLRPEAVGLVGYKTFFDKCSVSEIQALLKQLGFKDIMVKPYFRANSYFDFLIPAFIIVSVFENMCQLLNLTVFSTGVMIEARK